MKQWKAFQLASTIYDLSHLDGYVAEYTDSRDPAKPFIYRFFVTYSFHCFTKDDQSLNAIEREQLMYHAPKEARPFNFERYELSKKLPCIIKSLAQPHILVRHAGNDRFVTVKILDQEGNDIDYCVFFKVFRENKKLRIHVVSAYLRTDSLGKSRKIGFFTIAYNTLHNKPITIPP